MKTAFTVETQRRRERRLRAQFSVPLRLCGVLFAFVSCTTPPPGEIEETPDEPRPREAQSDFLDIGKHAGIEWLSFVPNDQREYPELFEGLDRDQKRHLRLAPLETPDERVLIEFKLPQGSKLWPVDWYGTEFMAIDLPGAPGFSVAIGRLNGRSNTSGDSLKLAMRRINVLSQSLKSIKLDAWELIEGGLNPGSFWLAGVESAPDKVPYAYYASTNLTGLTAKFGLYVEARQGDKPLSPNHEKGVATIIRSISIRRDLALEGFPKHKCSSSIEDLQAGKLIFPGGTLSLPLKAGQVARKIGGDSTIQVDGEGGKPWLILRRLKESGAEGDIRTRVRIDTTFARRVEKPSGRFSAGQRLDNGAVAWEYADSGAEQQLVGIVATGKELLAFEVVSHGLTDGEARRNAREAAQQLIGSAQVEAAGEPLKVLEGWNVGTMGREK